jgi:hypothetical protein
MINEGLFHGLLLLEGEGTPHDVYGQKTGMELRSHDCEASLECNPRQQLLTTLLFETRTLAILHGRKLKTQCWGEKHGFDNVRTTIIHDGYGCKVCEEKAHTGSSTLLPS